MSKRSEEAAMKAYPVVIEEHTERDLNKPRRLSYINGYEQAEKDTIERACEWMEKNIRLPHPRKGTDECIVNLNAFRKAMEEEK